MNVTDGDNCAHLCTVAPWRLHAVVRVKSCGKKLLGETNENKFTSSASLLQHLKRSHLKFQHQKAVARGNFRCMSHKQLPLWRLGGVGAALAVYDIEISELWWFTPIASAHTRCRMQCGLKCKAWVWRLVCTVGDQRSAMCNDCLFLIKVLRCFSC